MGGHGHGRLMMQALARPVLYAYCETRALSHPTGRAVDESRDDASPESTSMGLRRRAHASEGRRPHRKPLTPRTSMRTVLGIWNLVGRRYRPAFERKAERR